MKNKISKLFFVVCLVAATFTFANAQNQPKYANDMKQGQPGLCQKTCCGIPDLTADQTTKIEDIKLQHIKDVTLLKDQLKEKQARINTLMDAEKSDLVAINAAIDEFTGITNQLIKKKVEFKLAVRNLLTDKQKIMFDSKSDLFDNKGCNGMGGGKENAKCSKGHGAGPGPNHPNCPNHK